MSNKEKDKRKIIIIRKLSQKKLSVSGAAVALSLSERQIWRLLKRYQTEGRGGLAHRAKGRPSNNSIPAEVKDRVLALIREKYAPFGPTRIARELMKNEGLAMSRETLRLWMIAKGMWSAGRKA
jgi:transposase